MPPQEPKSEQLLAAVESRLKGIKSGTTYWSTPGEVERDWKNFDEVKSFPFYGRAPRRRNCSGSSPKCARRCAAR